MDLTFTNFTGINNVQAKFQLGVGKRGAELAAAVNVDVNELGRIQMREGYSTVLTGTNCHSIWAREDLCLYRQNDKLMRLFEDDTAVQLRAGLTTDAGMAYADAVTRVFMSDGVDTLQTDGSTTMRWGIEPPANQPLAAQAAAGSLPPGNYLFAVTYVREDGEESGTGLAGRIANIRNGIDFTAIPVSGDPDVTKKRIYLTQPNGQQLFMAVEIPNATTTASYTGNMLTSESLIPLSTQFKIPPPPGRVLALHNARMLVGWGAYLMASDPYRHELFDHEQVIPFSGTVRIIAPLIGGVLVATDREIVWLAGEDFEDYSPVVKARYAGIHGSAAYVDAEDISKELQGKAVMFATTQGIALVTEGGGFQNLTKNTYQYAVRSRAAAVFRRLSKLSSYTLVMR